MNAHSTTAVVWELGAQRMQMLQNLSIATWQGLNETVYGKQNRRYYSERWRLILRILANLGLVSKAVRGGNTRTLSHHLCAALSWTFALANNLKIDLEYEAWRRFPGVCPYCGKTPCETSCHAGERQPHRMALNEHVTSRGSLRDFQAMLARIYPHNELEDVAWHSMEELAEVGQAIDHWMGSTRTNFLSAQ